MGRIRAKKSDLIRFCLLAQLAGERNVWASLLRLLALILDPRIRWKIMNRFRKYCSLLKSVPYDAFHCPKSFWKIDGWIDR